jgi:hypothetical protein
MSLHDPKATFRTRSQVQYNASRLRRRQNRQGGLLPAVAPAAAPITPGNDEKRRRQRYERATRRQPWRGYQQRAAQQLHQYDPTLFSTGADAYTFTGADGAAWNPLWTFTTGSGGINTNRGRMVTGTGGFDGVSAWIDTAQADGTVQIDVEIPTNDAQFPELRFRFNTGNFDYVRILFEPHNDVVFMHDYDNDIQQSLLDSDTFAIAGGDVVHVKMVGAGTQVRVRLWLNADPEPSTYQLIGSTSFGASNTQLMVRTVTSNLGVAITNYWDNLVITSSTIDTVTTTIAGAVDAITSALPTTETIQTSIAALIDAITSTLDVDVSSTAVTATIDGVLADITSSFTTTEEIQAVIAGVVDALTSNVATTETIQTSIAATLDPITSSIDGLIPLQIVTSIAATIDAITSDLGLLIANPVYITIDAAIADITASIQAQRYGMEPDLLMRETIIFRGKQRRRYYDPNKNPVTRPSDSP